MKPFNQKNKNINLICTLIWLIMLPQFIFSQSGRIVTETMYSESIAINLLGDSPNRKVSVYLPIAYDQYPDSLFPVIYLLHGFTQTHTTFLSQGLKEYSDNFFSRPKVQSMIIVMPNANNKYEGSFYTNSYLTGNWEDFITLELVDFIDTNYRTIASVRSRGIAGFSMGGYGALKLAMKHPEIYGAVYSLSGAQIVMDDVTFRAKKSYLYQAVRATNFNDLVWQAQVFIAMAAAFTPDTSSSPFPCNFPMTADGVKIDSIWQKWLIHDPYTMIDIYKANLIQLMDIKFDCGTYDSNLIASQRIFSQKLTDEAIPHTYVEFSGGHGDKLQERIREHMLPFFSDIYWDENFGNNTAYGERVEVHPNYLSPQSDTLFISAQVANPENHPVSVYAHIQGDVSAYQDSVELFDDGLHNDSDAADNKYGGAISVSGLEEDLFTVELLIRDLSEKTALHLFKAIRFTTIGSVVFHSVSSRNADDVLEPGASIRLYVTLKNNGKTAVATDIETQLICLEPSWLDISADTKAYRDIAPGQTMQNSTSYRVDILEPYPGDTPIPMEIHVSSNGQLFWSDTFSIPVTVGVETEEEMEPKQFALYPNYPNPFNPSTTIRFDLPESGDVSLKVYTLLGAEVKTLIHGKMSVGEHQVQWNTIDQPSGVYLVRLEAGGFVQTRKMVVMK